ncbi:helix-turn-helix domain-containing protein [Candidatus Saccharibacteria bacterium]|nr:helix-turn-helix domain-containing protein [Candidatus Saccharibacteria bacterium]
MNLELAAQLQNISLTDKQARVYIASLSLGPNSAQNIAKAADVNRATTYVIIEELMGMGLVTQSEKSKRTVFVAAPPSAIKQYLEDVKTDLQNKIDELEKLQPQLEKLSTPTDLEHLKRQIIQSLNQAEIERLIAELQKS